MKNFIKGALIFVAGAATGVLATNLYYETKYRTKYEAIADEEIASVKERFEAIEAQRSEEAKEKAEISRNKPDLKEIAKVIASEGYSQELDPFDVYQPDPDDYDDDVNEGIPYVLSDRKFKDYIHIIPPEKYGEYDDYDRISFVYYADGVLTDDGEDPIDDYDDIIGPDALDHFGEYEDDSVFVQNDKYRNYYEILLDSRKYADIIQSHGPVEG